MIWQCVLWSGVAVANIANIGQAYNSVTIDYIIILKLWLITSGGFMKFTPRY